ncbi:MAG: hypothetical protein M1337_06265 [Actinobacteria bacterium]|nr:hypothetical protein [Actinomycetota bacterium]
MRKTILIVIVLSAVMVLGMSATAFADRAGTYWPQTQWSAKLGGGSPHGNYANTTEKCKVCHAVHGAGITNGTTVITERLLRSTVADACSFCHLSNAYATNPYGVSGSTAYASTSGATSGSGHFSTHQGTSYAGCASCHSVHGANTIGAVAADILKNDPAKGVVDTTATGTNGGWGSFKQVVTTQADFCQDCHDGTRYTNGGVVTAINNATDFAAQFPVCSDCHNSAATGINDTATQFGVSFNQGHNGRSHPMTITTIESGIGTVANKATAFASETETNNSCTTCHNVTRTPGTLGAPLATFPHYSTDQELIQGYNTTTNKIDGVCLSCHKDTAGTPAWGVGVSY